MPCAGTVTAEPLPGDRGPRPARRVGSLPTPPAIRPPMRSPIAVAAAPRPAPPSARRARTMVPLSAVAHFEPGQHAARGQSPGPVRRQHDLVQSDAGRLARRGDAGDRGGDGASRRAGDDPRHLPGHRPGVPGVADQRALSDRGRAARRLHRAGRALRELHPSDHDSVDIAVGRGRRGAGADAVQHRIQHHGADRRHPADRHRQEERDHDDRFRARRRAEPGARARARRSTRPA